MSFSLVLTSYDRAADLERFFRALASQSFQGLVEVNFVNQNPQRPASCDLLGKSVQLNVLQVGQLTPLSKARNLGLAQLSGEIVAIPDDDCWYQPQLLEDISAYFQNHPAVDCICTCVFDPERNLPVGKRAPTIHCSVGYRNVFDLGISSGIFIRKQALMRAGAYFDETLGVGTPIGSGEETDMLARLLGSGSRIEYVGSLRVYHPFPVFNPGDVSKNFLYSLGFGHLNARILRDGHPAVLWGVATLLIRSLCGVIVNLFRPVSRAVYWNRLIGTVSGFVSLMIHPARAAK